MSACLWFIGFACSNGSHLGAWIMVAVGWFMVFIIFDLPAYKATKDMERREERMARCKHENCHIYREQTITDRYTVAGGNPFWYGDTDGSQYTGRVRVRCNDCLGTFYYTNEKQYPKWVKKYIEEAIPY